MSLYHIGAEIQDNRLTPEERGRLKSPWYKTIGGYVVIGFLGFFGYQLLKR